MKFQYETDRLILRVLDESSAPQVLLFYKKNRRLFERYEAKRPLNFYTEDYTRRVLNYEYNLCIQQSGVRFWVFPKTEEELIIGTVCLRNITRNAYQSCEVGYKFDQAHFHQGYATEALQKGVWIAFHELELHRIVAHIMPENLPSIHLVERLGFEKEGLARKSAKIRGKWEDHLVYSLIS